MDPNKRPTSDWEDSRDAAISWGDVFFILHAYVSRTVLTFWWTTAIYIWLTNYPNAIILLILAWTINWPIDLQMGKNALVRVFALIMTSARWLLRSQMYSTNTCIHVVWLCSIGCLSTCVQIYCQGLPVGEMTNKPVGGKKTHPEETQSMFRKYNFSWKVVRGLWMRWVWLIIYHG